jgi:bifunctional non-homologous end joining protein LigD
MFEFCIPTKATIVPDGPDWLHEVKYDGYRASAWSATACA